MEPWRRELYVNELYHHGIKGQRWGVQNGPPYPLSSEVRERVLKQEKSGRRLLKGGVAAAVAGVGVKEVTKPIRLLNTFKRANEFVSKHSSLAFLSDTLQENVPQFVYDFLDTSVGQVLTSPAVNAFVRSPAISIIQGSLFAISAGLNAYGAYKYIRSGQDKGNDNPNANSTGQILKDVLKAVAIGTAPVLMDKALRMTPVRRFIRSNDLREVVRYGMDGVKVLSTLGVMQTSMKVVEESSAQVTRMINNETVKETNSK